MIDLDDFLKDLRIRAENLEGKYQIMINQIYSKFSIPYEINKSIIKNIYEESCHFFSKIIIDCIR